jgi:hypothetical protein
VLLGQAVQDRLARLVPVAFAWQEDQFGDAALACDRSIPAAARTTRVLRLLRHMQSPRRKRSTREVDCFLKSDF